MRVCDFSDRNFYTDKLSVTTIIKSIFANNITVTADKCTHSTIINNEFNISNGNNFTSVNRVFIKTIWEYCETICYKLYYKV